jgi:putative inorganic carbon (HCO3(-)) transporter
MWRIALMMNTRDLVLMGLLLAALPFCFTRPYFGGLMWTWVAFMNPHRLTWGYARYLFPPAYLVALPTLLGLMVSKEPKRMPWSYGTFAILTLWLLMTISYLDAINPVDAQTQWEERTKMLFMAMVIVMLTNTHERLRGLMLMSALSIGFFGFKGGIFAIMTGGQHRVYGPWMSFIEDNNAVALAMNMSLPLLFYLRHDLDRRDLLQGGLRLLLTATFVLSLFAVVSTHSRGGLLGLVTVVALLFLKNRRKLIGAVVVVAGVYGMLAFAPQQWGERMQTIETYDEDPSAVSRLHAWTLAWRLALAKPLIGWGPQAMEDKNLYDRFYPDSPTRNDVHSSYFQVLSESGFPAFFVWISLMLWSFATMQRIGWRFRRHPEHGWLATYADMLQISLAAYAVSGMFLELAYFNMVYHIFGGAIIVNDLAAQRVTAIKRVEAAERVRPRAMRVPAPARAGPGE